jgi:hypothetical protein
VRVFPLNPWLAATQAAWRKQPVAEGTRLAVMASGRNLLPLPTDAADWPQAGVAIGGGALRVVALRDPAVVARTTRARVILLAGAGLLAGAAMTAAWWRPGGGLVAGWWRQRAAVSPRCPSIPVSMVARVAEICSFCRQQRRSRLRRESCKSLEISR